MCKLNVHMFYIFKWHYENVYDSIFIIEEENASFSLGEPANCALPYYNDEP